MANWYVKCPNAYGEYEITFASKDRKQVKAVERLCCAIMDGKINLDKWNVWKEWSGTYFQCPNCNAIYCVSRGFDPYKFGHQNCPKCGAELEV